MYVLLDRDGVINERVMGGYVTSWEQFAFLPGALEGLRRLTQCGYIPIVVSNQAGVGKGLLSRETLDEITRRLLAQVEAAGGRLGGVYYCPHRDEDGCACRKPKPGLLFEAQKDHGFDFTETFLVGDSRSDLLAAQAVGCPAILVAAGAAPSLEGVATPPRAVVRDLAEAAEYIISSLTQGPYCR